MVAYLFFSVLMFGLCVAAVILGTKFKSSLDGRLVGAWNRSSSQVQEMVQREFRCCGWTASTPGPNCDIQYTEVPCSRPVTKEANLGADVIWAAAAAGAAIEALCCIGTGLVLFFVDYRRKEGSRGFQESSIPMTKAPVSTVHQGSVLADNNWKV